ncbi:MAG: hypothetical protein ABIV06_10880, partial [Thermoanaerobaculia bacterium]
VASAAPRATATPPRWVVQAPAELAADGREVELLAEASLAAAAELVGGDPAALLQEVMPVSVVLVPERSAAALAVPKWIAGYAISGRGPGEIVLFPARADRYPDFGLDAVLRHELTHLLVDRRAGPEGDLPRWFNEGLAMAVGRNPDWGDSARLTLAVIDDGALPLARLDTAFSGGETEVNTAYALAGDIVRELLARHGRASAARILDAIARGERFRDAFRSATGESLTDFETSYWGRRTLLDRWVPIVSSSVLLWGAISLLALAAIRRRRARDAARLARWGEEEGEVEIGPWIEADEAEAPDLRETGAGADWPPRKPAPKLWRRG